MGYFPITFSPKSSITCDSTEVSQLLSNEARHMSTKGEPNQMGVVVDVPKLKVDSLDEQGHLVVKQGLLELVQERAVRSPVSRPAWC